jgi:hypothetical protein
LRAPRCSSFHLTRTGTCKYNRCSSRVLAIVDTYTSVWINGIVFIVSRVGVLQRKGPLRARRLRSMINAFFLQCYFRLESMPSIRVDCRADVRRYRRLARSCDAHDPLDGSDSISWLAFPLHNGLGIWDTPPSQIVQSSPSSASRQPGLIRGPTRWHGNWSPHTSDRGGPSPLVCIVMMA